MCVNMYPTAEEKVCVRSIHWIRMRLVCISLTIGGHVGRLIAIVDAGDRPDESDLPRRSALDGQFTYQAVFEPSQSCQRRQVKFGFIRLNLTRRSKEANMQTHRIEQSPGANPGKKTHANIVVPVEEGATAGVKRRPQVVVWIGRH